MKQASNVNDTLLSKNVAMFMPNDACMHMYMYVCMFVCMYVQYVFPKPSTGSMGRDPLNASNEPS